MKRFLKYSIYIRYGNSHGKYLGEIKANNIEESFNKARLKYLKEHDDNRVTEFYVCNHPSYKNGKAIIKYESYGWNNLRSSVHRRNLNRPEKGE